MFSRLVIIAVVTGFLACCHSYGVYAQFQMLPTPLKEQPTKKTDASFFRSLETKLSLPFFDDFSIPGIDTLKWISEGVTHSYTVSNEAPSIGVILLDGIDERGRPYSNVPVEQGLTDRITSKPIDLSIIKEGEKGSVFLSFYWQAGGKGEMPDFNDDLTLMFLDKDELWVNVWSVSGDKPAEQFFFTQEIIQVDETFFHENFQFRFQASGRASGPFDSWLLDYIYLNKNRSETDLYSRDRALTSTNTRPTERFSAIPLFELKDADSAIWTHTSNEFKNLENRFRAMEYTVELRDKKDNSLLTRINTNTPFNPVPLALERRKFNSNVLADIPIPKEETDLELITYLNSGDRFLYQIVNGDSVFFDNVDLRINDTVKTVIPIRDFYAYDDGSVDYSAGINQRDGMLVNRFETSTPVYIKGVSINFTNFNQRDFVVDLSIWASLDQPPIYVREIFIPEKENLNDFSYFELEENIRVDDTFFVGFTQFTNDFIYVGLDKTFDNGEEIFFNVAGAWQQNELVEGSLMIRVHLSQDPPLEEEDIESVSPVKAFPNPVSDRLTLTGDFEQYAVYDPYGRLLNIPLEEDGNAKILNFAKLQKGVYLIKVQQGEQQQQSIRILVK